jgi:hypothetical protein
MEEIVDASPVSGNPLKRQLIIAPDEMNRVGRVVVLPRGRRSWLAYDLARSGSNAVALVVSDTAHAQDLLPVPGRS